VRTVIAVSLVILVLLVTGAAYYLLRPMPDATTGYAPAQQITPGPQNLAAITIPLSSVLSQAQFYTYDSGGTAVRYFTAMGPDGQPHLAADTCDVCYAEKKGYRQTGDSMTCNNCGKVFAIANVGKGNTAGGCWPSYIPVTQDGVNLVVQKSALDAKAFMFR
jgi:uncharacterized membrane protein